MQPVLPGLVPQVDVVDPVGRVVATFDLADEDLRLAVYRALATTGRAPSPPELARALGTAVQDVRRGLAALAGSRKGLGGTIEGLLGHGGTVG